MIVQTAPAIRALLWARSSAWIQRELWVTGKTGDPRCARWASPDVFDTNFAADLTILEEGTEFLGRVRLALTGVSPGASHGVTDMPSGGSHAKNDGLVGVSHGETGGSTGRETKPAEAVLPMITSCSPGWIKYVEHAWPDELDHLSTCKSPHTMLGALVKSHYARKIGRAPADLFVVSVMPCTAKKFEIARP